MRRVVVTGMGAITPLGNDVETTWKALLAGKSGATQITRFDASDFTTTIASEVKNFSPNDYMDPREAKRTDPFVWYAIAATRQAWKQACLESASVDLQRVGVTVGSGVGGITTFENQHSIYREKGSRRISPFYIPMMISNMAAGNISITFGAKGPVSSVVTACATGTNAIGDAFKTIARGDADVMVAGGSEASITPMSLGGFCAARALSTRNYDPEAASRPFDAERDGFVMGEGSGIVILEALESALKRDVKILAEITGYGSTSDAFHVVQPHPEGEGGARAMAAAIKDAGWQPEEVDYINAHGTSTEFNDKLETLGIKKVFGKHAYNMAVNSTKSMTGHLMGAAGALEFIVVIKTLLEQIVHPTINRTHPDPECDLDYVTEGARKVTAHKALSNSLGFGGHNATLTAARWEE
ncbi:MAG TPA: beta-ketoacyl-ACP synthase II [Candidatus Limnocylindrales bacterium]|nr:beta-ketoacyl-ACP synthase II [Candidatus Limnocylindrales bacterium]